MQYISVVNWEHFQHYRHRHPPWIKIHRSLLEDYEFGELPDHEKAHLMLMWLLASQTDNKIPADEQWLRKKLLTKRPVRLKPLIDKGFLQCVQDDSDALSKCSLHKQSPIASCYQSAGTEAETEAEVRTETEKRTLVNSAGPNVTPPPYSTIGTAWNTMAAGAGLPQVRLPLAENRRRKVKSRWAEWGGGEGATDHFAALLVEIGASSFLKGSSGWKATFDWLIKNDGNSQKVAEGHYRDTVPARKDLGASECCVCGESPDLLYNHDTKPGKYVCEKCR